MIDPYALEDISVAGVDRNDHPDYVDAYIEYATFEGQELTDEELNWVNENFPEIAHQHAFESLL